MAMVFTSGVQLDGLGHNWGGYRRSSESDASEDEDESVAPSEQEDDFEYKDGSKYDGSEFNDCDLVDEDEPIDEEGGNNEASSPASLEPQPEGEAAWEKARLAIIGELQNENSDIHLLLSVRTTQMEKGRRILSKYAPLHTQKN